MKTNSFICRLFLVFSVLLLAFSLLSVSADDFSIWMEGGNIGTYLHFHAWEGFSDETKHQFDLTFDEWNYSAYNAKPSDLWIDRSGDDTSQTQPGVINSSNDITKGNRGTGADTYTMATYATRFIYVYGEQTLVEVDIDVNGSYPWNNSVREGKLFVQNSFTHEIGHVYGLGDVYSYSGELPTMYGIYATGSDLKCTIEEDDIHGLMDIYGGN